MCKYSVKHNIINEYNKKTNKMQTIKLLRVFIVYSN